MGHETLLFDRGRFSHLWRVVSNPHRQWTNPVTLLCHIQTHTGSNPLARRIGQRKPTLSGQCSRHLCHFQIYLLCSADCLALFAAGPSMVGGGRTHPAAAFRRKFQPSGGAAVYSTDGQLVWKSSGTFGRGSPATGAVDLPTDYESSGNPIHQTNPHGRETKQKSTHDRRRGRGKRG